MKNCRVCGGKRELRGKRVKCLDCVNRGWAKYKNNRVDQVRNAKSKPCADCGIEYPYYVMQFDHTKEKLFNISQNITRVSMQTLMQEIAKCEVVCANCHAERTYLQSLTSA